MQGSVKLPCINASSLFLLITWLFQYQGSFASSIAMRRLTEWLAISQSCFVRKAVHRDG